METSRRDIIILVIASLIFAAVLVPSILVYGRQDNQSVVDEVDEADTEQVESKTPEPTSTSLGTTSFILRSITSSTSSSAVTSSGRQDANEEKEALTGRTEVERRVDDILSRTPLIDGHNDLAYSVKINLNNNVSLLELEDLTDIQPWASQTDSNTDIRRLREGKVGGQFWSAYIGCDSDDPVKEFVEQMDVIKQIVAKYPETFHYADSVAGIRAGFRAGKVSSLIGVESGHAINSSLGVLRSLYTLGARYMTLTHSCNTPWAESSPSEYVRDGSKGLTQFGREVIQEMNRLGMIVDISHVSGQTMMDAIKASSAPVMFSHSSARALNDHDRNVPDRVLRMIRDTGGVVMVNFYSCYLIPDCEEREATVQDVVTHINYIRSVAGVDSLGLGSDFNGVSQYPRGLKDVSGFPNIFTALIQDKVGLGQTLYCLT